MEQQAMTIEMLYQRARDNVYREDDSTFRDDAEAAFEFKDMPLDVKSRIHSIAWEDGHSAGYYEVVNHYFELVDLAKLCFKNK